MHRDDKIQDIFDSIMSQYIVLRMYSMHTHNQTQLKLALSYLNTATDAALDQQIIFLNLMSERLRKCIDENMSTDDDYFEEVRYYITENVDCALQLKRF